MLKLWKEHKWIDKYCVHDEEYAKDHSCNVE